MSKKISIRQGCWNHTLNAVYHLAIKVHSLHDCCLSALAMMFFQDPSMLAFQQRLQNSNSRNNLQTLFDVQSIPKESQMKDVLDSIPYESFYPIFPEFLSRLQRAKKLESYQYINDSYLLALDGTQYFESESISCDQCLTKTLKNGNTLFYHQTLAATMVHPDLRQVIPFAPEPIKNGDGSKKQDCERNAGKRIIDRIRPLDSVGCTSVLICTVSPWLLLRVSGPRFFIFKIGYKRHRCLLWLRFLILPRPQYMGTGLVKKGTWPGLNMPINTIKNLLLPIEKDKG